MAGDNYCREHRRSCDSHYPLPVFYAEEQAIRPVSGEYSRRDNPGLLHGPPREGSGNSSSDIPPVAATAAALIFSSRYAPALAYICGTMGTLLGADILHLPDIRGLGAPVASIGGAGTFDGIFVTGILAVLLASVMTGKAEKTS